MDEMTMLLQENMELYAENERLYQALNAKNKPKKRKKRTVSPEIQKRNDEMNTLRWGKSWTLQEIADEYGISRERVRQIVGNSGYKNAKTKRNKAATLANSYMINDDIAQALGVSVPTVSKYRRGTRHAIKGSNLYVGVEKEESYAKTLESMGMNVELMPHSHKYDAIVNGYRVDFKYCGTEYNPPSMHKSKYPRWRFNVRSGEKRDDCDFYFCVTANDDVFIIPSLLVPRTMNHLIFTYPRGRTGMAAKWQLYKDRYDLLEERQENES